MLPGSPRCKVCNAPYGGPAALPFRAFGYRPSQKTPYVCARCIEWAPEGGAIAPMSVLLLEVRTYAGMVHALPPSEVPVLLNRFFGLASRVILRHEGILGQISGDQAMGLFVPGLCGHDYPARAVDAASAVLETVGYGTARGPWLEVAIGIATGEGFCGNVGGGGFKDFTAVGEVPNAADRLRARAGPGEVLVDSDTCVAADRFTFAMADPIVVGPKSPAIDTFRLLRGDIASAAADYPSAVMFRSSLFSGLSPQVESTLKRRVHRRRFAAGTLIARAGEPAEALYVIEAGVVRAALTSRQGHERLLGLFTTGDCLCEVGVLEPSGTHTADLVAVESTTCVCISREDLVAAVRSHPELSLRLLGALAAHARRREQELADLAFLDVSSRVGRQLLQLAARYGTRVERGIRIGAPVSQSDLAAMVGASREHVNRALSRFARLDAVSVNRSGIVITDPDRLRSLC
jgi:adenylate cyclase